MKNTFYRPLEADVREFQTVVTKMRNDLSELISGNAKRQEVVEYVRKLIQDGKPLEKNSDMVFWGLAEPETMPSDARVDFFYIPTYITVSILAYAMLNSMQEVIQLEGFKETLRKGLLAATGRDFLGHGFDYKEGLIDALDIFASADIFTFTKVYRDICPTFTSKLSEATALLESKLEAGKIKSTMGEDYPVKAKSIISKQKISSENKTIFAYGTLLRGNSNFNGFLANSKYIGDATLHGYALYDLGSFPGIKQDKNDFVKGELFEINPQTYRRINHLEGEGSLYAFKTEAVVMNGNNVPDVGVYVYLHDVNEENYVSHDNQPWRG